MTDKKELNKFKANLAKVVNDVQKYDKFVGLRLKVECNLFFDFLQRALLFLKKKDSSKQYFTQDKIKATKQKTKN